MATCFLGESLNYTEPHHEQCWVGSKFGMICDVRDWRSEQGEIIFVCKVILKPWDTWDWTAIWMWNLYCRNIEEHRIQIIGRIFPLGWKLRMTERKNFVKINCVNSIWSLSVFIECDATLQQELHCFSFITFMEVITFHEDD